MLDRVGGRGGLGRPEDLACPPGARQPGQVYRDADESAAWDLPGRLATHTGDRLGVPPQRLADWLRVSTGHQDSDKEVPEVKRFAAHHGYEITTRYVVSDSA